MTDKCMICKCEVYPPLDNKKGNMVLVFSDTPTEIYCNDCFRKKKANEILNKNPKCQTCQISLTKDNIVIIFNKGKLTEIYCKECYF